jgi:DNA-binding response OmpR family regulator
MLAGPDSSPLPNIPLIHRPGEQPAATLRRPPLAIRKRVLIVDDEVPILKLVTRILSTDKYDISAAESGEEAAQMVAHPEYPGLDLLVTDLMMPGMSGRQLGEIVRSKYPNARVLYVTGFADVLFQGVQELGDGESFIEKPFGPDGLLEATRLLMFGHISEGEEPPDRHDDADEWADARLRAKVVRVLRRFGMA